MRRSLILAGVVAALSAMLWVTTAGPVPAVHTISADDAVLQQAARSGFRTIVQLLEWRQVEPVPGEYYWEYADWLVRACEHYGLNLVLRLDHPPEWAVRTGHSPPVQLEAYAAYVQRVSARYRGRVQAYIIWNEPNLAAEWNGQQPDPAGYRALLEAGAGAARQGDPGALVIAAGLAPTNQSDPQAMSDLDFLQALYAPGQGTTWDAQAVHPYGFAQPPIAPASEHHGLVFSRLHTWQQLLREQGVAAMPLWVTEFGWTVGPTDPADTWQMVTLSDQADYLAGAFALTARAYPRVPLLTVWNLAPHLAPHDPMSGFSLIDPDGTVRPALDVLEDTRLLRRSRAANALRAMLRRLTYRPESVEALAADVIVRLSDTDIAYPHWAKPHGGTAPARTWETTFYLDDQGSGSWRLVLETMQVEEQANLIYINNHRLDAALPVIGRTPFTSVWTTSTLEVPAEFLRSGANVLRLELSPRPRTQQDIRYEGMQVRHVRLMR